MRKPVLAEKTMEHTAGYDMSNLPDYESPYPITSDDHKYIAYMGETEEGHLFLITAYVLEVDSYVVLGPGVLGHQDIYITIPYQYTFNGSTIYLDGDMIGVLSPCYDASEGYDEVFRTEDGSLEGTTPYGEVIDYGSYDLDDGRQILYSYEKYGTFNYLYNYAVPLGDNTGVMVHFYQNYKPDEHFGAHRSIVDGVRPA